MSNLESNKDISFWATLYIFLVQVVSKSLRLKH